MKPEQEHELETNPNGIYVCSICGARMNYVFPDGLESWVVGSVECDVCGHYACCKEEEA